MFVLDNVIKVALSKPKDQREWMIRRNNWVVYRIARLFGKVREV